MEEVSLPSVESREYHRRDPEQTMLYQVVREYLNTFLEYADTRSEGKCLPPYVKNTFRAYLKCGVAAWGFARVRCPECGYDTVVAFSCKQRGICPSCEGRRMADTAAHLVDHVFPPEVPARQWVLSLPRPIRYILARDYRLVTGVLNIFVGEIFKRLRGKAGIRRAKDGLCGAVTAIQRFGGALNANLHLHTMALDGVYRRDAASGGLSFRKVGPPSHDDLDRVLGGTARRILKYLKGKGYVLGDPGVGEQQITPPDAEDPTLMDTIQAASIRELIGLSGDARRVEVEGRDPRHRWVEPAEKPYAIRSGDGWSLEAAVRIKGTDREGLERVCRYILRPPFAEGRLERLADGRIRYGFRRPRTDGSTAMILSPLEFLEKLAALIPPPRAHLTRYSGVLGPHAGVREGVVPPETPEEKACDHDHDDHEETESRPRRRGRRKLLSWATLLKRTFGIDVLKCPNCGSRMKVIACIEEVEVARKILLAMGLSWEIPRAAPARPPPQGRFEFDQVG